MLDRCLAAIRLSRPGLSPLARTVVEAIHLVGGPIGSADAVARHLGVGSRFRLARLLKREGLPPLHRIAGWAAVVSWVLEAEATGASLCRMAFDSDRYPAACYRLVKEITGVTWEAVRERGSEWAERTFLREMGVDNAALVPRPSEPVRRCRVPSYSPLQRGDGLALRMGFSHLQRRSYPLIGADAVEHFGGAPAGDPAASERRSKGSRGDLVGDFA